LILEPNAPSFASQKCTGGEKTKFIECKASRMIPSKSTLAENGEKVSEDSRNADAAICEHEQDPSDDEEIELDWTKEALTFKWYEKPQENDDNQEKRPEEGDPGQSKTCRALAEGVRQPLDGARLVKSSEKFRTLQEDTSSERGTDDLDLDIFDFRSIKNPRPTKIKSRKPQTDVGNSDDILLLCTTNATADKSHMTPTMCAQSATLTNMWLQMLQGHKRKVGTSRCVTGLQ
jgi:hypothetical protein